MDRTGRRTRNLAIALAVAFIAAGCLGGGSDVQGGSSDDGDAEHFVKGLIVDSSFLPVSGATVTVSEGDVSTVTGPAGNFTLGPLAPGTVELIVQIPGYETASRQVDVPYAGDDLVLTLEPTSTDVPYHQTYTFVGYYDCMIAAKYPPGGNPTWPCVGILDLAFGTNLSRDVWIFPFTIDDPGFQGLLAELTWTEQATAEWMGVSIRNEGLDETGAQTFFYNASLPDLRSWVYAGETNPGGDAPFYPEPNETAEYLFLTSSATEPGTAVDFQLWLSHRSTLYSTFFYHRLGSDQFTALPDA